MALPKLATPTYDVELPSTGKRIDFRPFLVKEEKMLLMALQGGKESEVVRSVKQVIANCVTTEEFDVEALTSYDLEWLFLQLRAKSVGEIVTLRFKHRKGKNRSGKECDGISEVEVNIDDIQLNWGKKVDSKVKLTDTVGVKLRHPTVETITKVTEQFPGNNQLVDRVMALLMDCTEYIWDEDNIHKIKDSKPEDVEAFFDSLTSEQYKNIEQFFTSVPKLEYRMHYKCNKCGEETTHILSGLQDFFG